MAVRDLILERIRTDGPITVAEYMELALYHPELGYYARAPQRSGRAGDFFTSVDLGPLFGELLAVQIAEMGRLVATPSGLDLVEVGAGNGRLARDLLDGLAVIDATLAATVRLHLVERSPQARAAQPFTLGPHAVRLVTNGDTLPEQICGVILAHELLDAFPTHVVTMTAHGLREVYVDEAQNRLVDRLGPLSTPAIAEYLARAGVRLRPGWRAEVNLAAVAWVRATARTLARGFLIIVDYGHEADQLYSAAHAAGTLAAYRRHAVDPAPDGWLAEPGERDLTAHVDFTAVRLAAEGEGLRTLAALDQTYFLLGLGIADRLAVESGDPVADLKGRLAAKTLLLPGGLGSTHKVLIFGRRVGSQPLRAVSYSTRLT